MSVKAIETLKLSKFYGKSRGMENVNLEIEKGEIFGFIGPNGAGKSTTIRTLLNLLFPTSGYGNIFGFDIVKQAKQVKKIVGYLPAEVNYYYKMSVKELLEYSQRFYNNTEYNGIKKLAEALDLDLNMKIRNLSLGNKKKVSIAQCLLHKPELLILDEPTSGLDPLIQSIVFDLLNEENKRGATIFFSSHVLSDVQKICSRVAIIQKGKIIKIESIETLRKKLLKKVKIEASENIEISQASIAGINEFEKNDFHISFMYNGDINELLKFFTQHNLKNISIEEPTLEEIFLHFYRNNS